MDIHIDQSDSEMLDTQAAVPSQLHLKASDMVATNQSPVDASSEDAAENEGSGGTYVIQDLRPDSSDDESDVEGRTIGPTPEVNLNEALPGLKNILGKPHFVPIEAEVLVYTSVEEEVAVKKALEGDLSEAEARLRPEKLQELKNKLATSPVPSRNPNLPASNYENIKYQLDQAAMNTAIDHQEEGDINIIGAFDEMDMEKQFVKPKSRWRRFLRGVHRRISFLLPGFLKKAKSNRI